MSTATLMPSTVTLSSLDEVFGLACMAGTAEVDDLEMVKAGIVASERLMAWSEAQRLRLVGAMGSRTDAIDALTQSGRVSASEASRTWKRAEAAAQAPEFADALAAGAITAAHVDRLGESLRRLDPERRQRLLAIAARLVAQASRVTASEFERILKVEERKLGHQPSETDHDRRKGLVRLREWTDRDSGMHEYRLTLDPERAVALSQRINAVAEAIFHAQPIAGCPTDPVDKQSFIRAHALLQLLEGTGPRPGRPEVVVVVDATGDGPPEVDWGLPVEIPQRVLDDLAGTADITTVVVRNGIVLYAPGEMNLGRTTRLASRAQRRALRGLHRTCMIPGCSTRFDQCTIHHIHWWRHGGRTDLHNLGPICHRHHHLIHDSGWILTLDTNRHLTIITPDGAQRTSRPPGDGPP